MLPPGDRTVTELYQNTRIPLDLSSMPMVSALWMGELTSATIRCAKCGREILQQPLGMAVQIFDDKVKHLLRDEYRIDQVTKAETQTIEELADQLGINREGLVQTIKEYNTAVQPGEYNPTILDGKHTLGITPPKSNWALPIDTPPYLGFAVTCGITFTFGGLRINARAGAGY